MSADHRHLELPARRARVASRTAGGVLPPLGRTLLVVLVLVGVALVGWTLALNERWPFAQDGARLTLAFDDGGGLRGADGSLVTVAGVASGRVLGVEHEGGRAIAQIRLDDDALGKVRAGARAIVRPRSQLGQLVVELSPGPRAGRPLRDGDRIPASRTAASVPASRVVSTLDADTRTSLQLLIGELAAGIGDARGSALAAALRDLEPVARNTDGVLGALDRRRSLLTRLVGHLDVLFTASGRHDEELRRAIASARSTLTVTGRQSAALRRTVAALPGTLRSTRAAVTAFGDLGTDLNPALRRLRPVARELPATLRAVRTALPSLDATLRDAAQAVARSDRAAAGAAQTAAVLRTSAPALQPAAERVDPTLAPIDRHADGIGLLGERFSGIFSTADANGTLLRGLGFFETFNPANFGFGASARSGAGRERAADQVVRASLRACRENGFACLLPFLVPGLQDAAARSASGLVPDASGGAVARSGATADGTRRATTGGGRPATGADPAASPAGTVGRGAQDDRTAAAQRALSTLLGGSR